MRPNEIEDEEEEFRGPSKSHLKRVQLDLQSLGRDMTRMGDETLAKIGLPEDVLVEIIEFRRMKSFGAQRRQLQLIGKKMRDMDPDAVREAIRKKSREDNKRVMASMGTTPRRLTDLIGSLCDLTSGSGDKGTPIILVQGYFNNYAD